METRYNSLNPTILHPFFLFLLVFFLLYPHQVAYSSAQSKKFLQQGNAYFRKFDHQKAVEYYQKVLKVDSTKEQRFEATWKISRSLVDIGEEVSGDRDKKISYYEKALKYAEMAVEINSESVWPYIVRSTSRGKIAQYKGIWTSISIVTKVVKDTRKAIELAPNNPTAHFMLGRVNLELAEKPYLFRLPLGLGWASTRKAVSSLEKAISLFPPTNPIQIRTHLRLGEAYLKLHKTEKAKKHLTAAMNLPIRDHQDEYLKEKAKDIYRSEFNV